MSILRAIALILLTGIAANAQVHLPFPQSHSQYAKDYGTGISNYYRYWRVKYLMPSPSVANGYKVNFDKKGTTVSEAMGYGMLLTVYMAGADPDARKAFDGLNLFRKQFPSNLDPGLMCWKIPANEKPKKDDCATDGDLDMAFALLLAHRQWGDESYRTEATNLIQHIAKSLVRSDYSLRLGDWNSAAGQTRPSDFMPTHFRAFYHATHDGSWTNVEARCYFILNQLQTQSAPTSGLLPDFAVAKSDQWNPARPQFLESPHDGEYYYNACRVPWRIGWAALALKDDRAKQIESRLMTWARRHCASPEEFRAGYKLDGANFSGNDYDAACFVTPTGVAAVAVGNDTWARAVIEYALKKKEGYFEDTVSLLSLLALSGNSWLPE